MKVHFPSFDFWFSITKAFSGFGTPAIFFDSLRITRSSNVSFFAADSIVSFTIWCKYPSSFFSLFRFTDHCLSYFRESDIKAFISFPSCCLFQRNALFEIHCGKLTSSEHSNIRKLLSFRNPFIIKGMVNFQNSCMTELGKMC